MPLAPKKNISNEIGDIQHPRKRKKQPVYIATWPLDRLENPPPKIKKTKVNWRWLAAVAVVAAINIFIFNLLDFRHLALGKAGIIYEELVRGKDALAELNPEAAEKAFLLADQELNLVRKKARVLGYLPILKEIPEAIQNLSELNKTNLTIVQDLNYLKNQGLALSLNNNGEAVIQTLERLHQNIGELITLNSRIKNNKLASLGKTFDARYVDFSVNLLKAKEWLYSLISVLNSPAERHLLVIFQNPSEMRPAGGFIGSHADIAIEKGSIKKIAVDDIYNADRQLELKIIPPKPMQFLTRDWGARDANWFFNFPTSAQKIIYLLENSKLYKNRGINFLGLMAVNVNVLESLLEITGPVELPEYQLTLSKENFLKEVQYEVEAGRDKKPGQNPKKILGVIAPKILEKLTNLPEGGKTLVLEKLQKHLQEKDILIYFKDRGLNEFIVEAGASGEIFPTPRSFSGDYLAVVNANLAGGKTDAFIAQKIFLKSEVKNNGAIRNTLLVNRRHSGQNEKEWWYKTANKNFIKILVPQNSNLIEIKGNEYQAAQPAINYQRAGYQTDPELQKIEAAEFRKKLQTEIGEELDKSYFATWFNVPAGASKNLELTYEYSRRLLVRDGAAYQFVFDKQSGVRSSLHYSITAPIGYVWKESSNETFEYETQNPRAREIIQLTLKKI